MVMHFLGIFPLIFTADSTGNCFIHTVRPVDPAFLLVCAWKHGNYWPTCIPIDFRIRQEFDMKDANVNALLYP